MRKIENLDEIPEDVRIILREVTESILQEVEGSFEYYEADNAHNSITLVWTGKFANSKPEDVPVTITHRVASRIFQREDVVAVNDISNAFMKKYNTVHRMSDSGIMPVSSNETEMTGPFDPQKQQAYNLAESIANSLGYIVISKESFEELKKWKRFLDPILKEYKAHPDFDGTYQEFIDDLLKEWKKYDQLIAKIKEALHSTF